MSPRAMYLLLDNIPSFPVSTGNFFWHVRKKTGRFLSNMQKKVGSCIQTHMLLLKDLLPVGIGRVDGGRLVPQGEGIVPPQANHLAYEK